MGEFGVTVRPKSWTLIVIGAVCVKPPPVPTTVNGKTPGGVTLSVVDTVNIDVPAGLVGERLKDDGLKVADMPAGIPVAPVTLRVSVPVNPNMPRDETK